MKIKRTITSIFMVPTLKIPRYKLRENDFIDGYSKDSHRDIQYDDSVYLLFKPKDLNKFRVFLDSEYERTKQVIDDYDYKDGYVVVVYKLDPAFKEDFDLVREGKYSKTSEKFQALFPKVVKIVKDGLHRDEISLHYRIFHKTEDLIRFQEDRLAVQLGRDQEVWGGFYEEYETLDIDKIKEYVE